MMMESPPLEGVMGGISPAILLKDCIFPDGGAIWLDKAELALGREAPFGRSGGDISFPRCSRNASCLGTRNLKALTAQTVVIES
jgi:hypothetical protein